MSVKRKVEIRQFAPEDKSAVIALVLGIQNDEFGLNLSLDDQKDLLDVKQHYKESGGNFWVGVGINGEVIGSIGLLIKSPNVGVMKKFFVASEYRGSKFGVADSLYKQLVKHAEKAGLRQIVLDTPALAERSHSFYRRVGFAEISRSMLPVSYDFPERDTKFFLLNLRGE
jgi:N-acetylglutamate synthase-like GNAT family acetyltransferase